MNAPLPVNGESGAPDLTPKAPYLSHSRISKYLLCPEQYRLHYVENLRPKITDASLVFGQVVHQALEALFRGGDDPVTRFGLLSKRFEGEALGYKERESCESLAATGAALLGRFVRESQLGDDFPDDIDDSVQARFEETGGQFATESRSTSLAAMGCRWGTPRRFSAARRTLRSR